MKREMTARLPVTVSSVQPWLYVALPVSLCKENRFKCLRYMALSEGRLGPENCNRKTNRSWSVQQL